MRLWRSLGAPATLDEVTAIKIQGALQQILGGEYTSPSLLHRDVQTLMLENPSGWFSTLSMNLSETTSRRAPLESNWPHNGPKPLAKLAVLCCAALYRATGFDYLERRLRQAGVKPGELMDEILKDRTGEVRVSWKSERVEGSRDAGN
jgi:hypothetical protein